MKEEYVLYLDESESTNTSSFVIGGFAIKKSSIPSIENDITAIKQMLWTSEYINEHNPSLHCTELQTVFTYRGKDKIPCRRDEYIFWGQKEKEEIEKIYFQLYGRLAKTLKENKVTIFSCVIKLKQLRELFVIDENHDGNHLIDDKYNIALQRIIENYTHFLSVVDGYGDVVYESRNSLGENSSKSPDIRLINDYHRIQANNKGIVYTNCSIIQDRNHSFQTYSKDASIAGLEIADFIAYHINQFKNHAVVTDFMKLLHRLSYNGGCDIDENDQRDFWGMNVLPIYSEIKRLTSDNKTLFSENTKLKNSYKSLKKDRNRLQQINKDYALKIEKLEQELNNCKAQIQAIKDQPKQ